MKDDHLDGQRWGAVVPVLMADRQDYEDRFSYRQQGVNGDDGIS